MLRYYSLAIAALLLVGCERSSKFDRIPLEGSATLNGQPFVGSISFRPEPGVTGPVASAPVANGIFAFDETNGPVSGPHLAFLMPKKESRDDASVHTSIQVPGEQPYRIEIVINATPDTAAVRRQPISPDTDDSGK